MAKKCKDRIRNLREEKKLNQTQIAQLLNTSQTVYSRYERGERKIPVDHLIALAKFYSTSTDYILGLTNERHPYPKA